MNPQQMLPSTTQLQHVINHNQKQKRAWQAIREASEQIVTLNADMTHDEERALYGVLNDAGSVDCLFKGLQLLAETKIAEADASLDLHQKLMEQAKSNIVVPDLGRPT